MKKWFLNCRPYCTEKGIPLLCLIYGKFETACRRSITPCNTKSQVFVKLTTNCLQQKAWFIICTKDCHLTLSMLFLLSDSRASCSQKVLHVCDSKKLLVASSPRLPTQNNSSSWSKLPSIVAISGSVRQ